jgi:hypothetical protein
VTALKGLDGVEIEAMDLLDPASIGAFAAMSRRSPGSRTAWMSPSPLERPETMCWLVQTTSASSKIC